MRVKDIQITEWRNFRNISIVVPDEAPLVCLVGANGTGKTHILELIASCAHYVGLSSGIEIPRGNPFNDPVREFSVQFFVAAGVSRAIDLLAISNPAAYDQWDRTVTVSGNGELRAGGIADQKISINFARDVANALRQSEEVHLLSLDADRAFPRRDLQTHEMAQGFETEWDNTSWRKGRSFQTTRTLYDEWIKYCLARENKAANALYQSMRRAKEENLPAPAFSDAFMTYRESLRQVMPHLLFAGAKQEQKAIIFDTAGMELRFDQLSGGEREIAFLVGQIDRFGLRNGIFLLDEPELHLNPDLVRAWVTYLVNTVSTGQVWLSTHSLEAVEAAGSEATILLERNEDIKLVDKVSKLSEKPVLSALSRAVGTPAFSISGLRFVLIEGEEAIGERERFRKIADLASDTRFIECGSCGEVIRRLRAINSLANEANQSIRISGIVDRDWRSATVLRELSSHQGLMVLPVHEIENFFIHKETLCGLAVQNGLSAFDYDVEILAACDARAGGWILQSAVSDEKQRDISDLPTVAKALAHGMTWSQIEPDIDAAMTSISTASGFDQNLQNKLRTQLIAFAKIYARKRMTTDLWKLCEGKEVAKSLARALGWSGIDALEAAVIAFWQIDKTRLPSEVKALRKALRST